MFPYEHPVEPETVGIDKRRLKKVLDCFRGQQASGLLPGGQLALRRNGEPVLNETCGIARGLRPGEEIARVKVRPDIVFPDLTPL